MKTLVARTLIRWPIRGVGVFVLLLALFGFAVPLSAQEDKAYDFSMSEAFLKELAKQDSINFKIKLRLDHRTAKVHALEKDCEIHVATKALTGQLFPSGAVVEPPNLCKEPAPGAAGATWPQVFDDQVMTKECEVTGFPRLFTEHAGGQPLPANPNHFFEMHPALAIKPVSGGDGLDFQTFLKFHEGLPSIKPVSAASCMEKRKLSVRREKGKYFFREDGGTCGNFIKVEATIPQEWIKKIKGGFSAIARVTPPEEGTYSLKIYGMEGTPGGALLEGLMTQESDGRIFLHGLLTYDYFAILRTVRQQDGTWLKISNWKAVPFPLALVIFGEAKGTEDPDDE
jgi:hypothetical protein